MSWLLIFKPALCQFQDVQEFQFRSSALSIEKAIYHQLLKLCGFFLYLVNIYNFKDY